MDTLDSAEIIEINGRPHYRYADGTTLAVIAGGDGSTENEDAENGDAEGDDSESTDDAAGAEDEAEGGDSGAGDAVEAFADLPVVDADAEEDDLRAAYDALGELRAEIASRPTPSATDAEIVEEAARRQAEIVEILNGRNAAIEEARRAVEEANESVPALPEPVRASAADLARVRGRQRRDELTSTAQRDRDDEQRPVVAMLGGSGQSTIEPGHEIDAAAFGEVAKGILASRRTVPAVIATLPPAEATETMGNHQAVTTNDRLIGEAVERWEDRRARLSEGEPVLASLCQVGDVVREIPATFSESSPVADSQPSGALGRGSVTLTRALTVADVAGGTTVWTEDNQDAVERAEPATWKPVYELECGDPVTVESVTIPGRVTFNDSLELSSPETVENVQRLVNGAMQRRKDGYLLSRIDAESEPVGDQPFGGFGNGFVSTLVHGVHAALAQATWAPRIEDGEPYNLYLQREAIAAIRIEQAQRAYGVDRDMAEAEALVREAFAAHGIDVIVTLDAVGGNPLPNLALGVGLPATTPIRLEAPRGAIYASSGQVNVGITRSPELLAQNKAQFFAEERIIFARHGAPPWVSFDQELCPSGIRSGLNDDVVCEALGS